MTTFGDEETAGTEGERAPLPDEGFIQRALDQADFNALRVALYQATGDESLLSMKIEHVPFNGGATTAVQVAAEEHAGLMQRVLDFLRDKPADFAETTPDEAQLRQLMEELRREPLNDREFAYRRDIPAFADFPRLARWSTASRDIPEGFQVAVIGAGASGVAMGVQLEQLGIPYVIFERRPRVGGTWEINRYPDIRVDVPNLMYEFTFAKKYRWSEYFAQGPQMREYLEHVARKFGVYNHIEFNRSVVAAAFDEATGRWLLDIAGKGSTEQRWVNVVIPATGLFATPKKLDLPGMRDFSGMIVHSAEWTGDEVYEDRNVAIIGVGSSGVQMLRPIREKARNVHVFQRTPQWISPYLSYRDPVSAETQWLLSAMPYYWNWRTYSYLATRLTLQSLQEIDPGYEAQGGRVNKYNDFLRESLLRYIDSELGSRPDLAAKVTPNYAPWARRMVVDNAWYASLLADNVELVTDNIERLTETGIRTVDGTDRPVDLIVTATGFTVTKYLWPTRYTGLGGVCLHELWDAPEEAGPRAYLGLTVPGFPNLFILYGPNSQTRSGSLLLWMEVWSRYVGQAIIELIEGRHRYANVRKDVFEDYNQRLDEASRSLIWSEAGSADKNYYVNAYGRQQVNMPWRVEDAYEMFERFNRDDYTFG